MKYKINKIKFLFQKHSLLAYFCLFIFAFSFFSWLEASPTFPDPDSFYHAKMASLIIDQGIIKNFPWLPFTVLKNYYIDHHLLYHILLVPFVYFLGPLVGIKLATTLLATLAIITFYWLLKKFTIRFAAFYSLLLTLTYPFIIRINLAKTSALSIIILLLALYFIFNKKYLALFLLSFLYVWTYGGWPLVIVLVIFYILGEAIARSLSKKNGLWLAGHDPRPKLKKYWSVVIGQWSLFVKQLISTANFKLLGAVLGGVITGLIINPYFPKNLYFYWEQIVRIAIINYQGTIGVGNEWYPYSLYQALSTIPLIFTLFIGGTSLLIIYLLEQKKADSKHLSQTITLFLLSFLFFILILRSKRHIEYFVPLTVIFAAFAVNLWIKNKPLKIIRQKIKELLLTGKLRYSLIITGLIFLLMTGYIMGRDVKAAKQTFDRGYSAYKFSGAAVWLKDNSAPQSIVFHNDWDDFPLFFFRNSHNRYIVGLDPTFMYDYNKDLYWQWVNITTGKQKENLYRTIKNSFRAEFIFVDSDHKKFNDNLNKDPQFKKVYEDGEGIIYKL